MFRPPPIRGRQTPENRHIRRRFLCAVAESASGRNRSGASDRHAERVPVLLIAAAVAVGGAHRQAHACGAHGATVALAVSVALLVAVAGSPFAAAAVLAGVLAGDLVPTPAVSAGRR